MYYLTVSVHQQSGHTRPGCHQGVIGSFLSGACGLCPSSHGVGRIQFLALVVLFSCCQLGHSQFPSAALCCGGAFSQFTSRPAGKPLSSVKTFLKPFIKNFPLIRPGPLRTASFLTGSRSTGIGNLVTPERSFHLDQVMIHSRELHPSLCHILFSNQVTDPACTQGVGITQQRELLGLTLGVPDVHSYGIMQQRRKHLVLGERKRENAGAMSSSR